MSIIIEVNGVPYNNFLKGRVNIRLDSLCNTFHFIIAKNDNSVLPFSVSDKCKVLVNNVLVLTGVIEVLEVTYDKDSHTLDISGRDNTSDIVDSYIDNLSDIGKGVSLKNIIEKIIEDIGSDVKVLEGTEINETSRNEFDTNDVASPEPGSSAFEFIEHLARQRQVLLTSNGDGNIVITQGSQEKLGNAKLQNIINGKDNNILRGKVTYNNSNRFNLYKITSQDNVSAFEAGESTDLDDVVDIKGQTIDNSIKKGRQLTINAEEAYDESDSFNRAEWEANIRKVRGRAYGVDVAGHAYDGDFNSDKIWEINKVIPVVDVFCGIDGNMLINDIMFQVDLQRGSITKINLLEKNAYSLVLDEPIVVMDEKIR
jgi:prophage tail gpP-like protein